MGNTGSCEGPYADIELTALESPIVAIDKRFVSSDVTRLRLKETSSFSKNLTFKDVYTRQVLFQTGADWELNELLDADKKPIVTVSVKKDIKNIYFVHRADAAAESENDKEEAKSKDESTLLQIYIKQGLITKTGYLDTTLRVDFTDMTTGERCKIEMQGEWRSRSAMLWLQQGHDRPRAAIGKIYRPPKALRNGFNLDIAPGVDTALVLLICAVVDDDLKRLRQRENRLGFWA